MTGPDNPDVFVTGVRLARQLARAGRSICTTCFHFERAKSVRTLGEN